MSTSTQKQRNDASPSKDSDKSTVDPNEINGNMEPIRIKLLTLGSVKVGKSCFVKKYCEKNRFASSYIPTIGVDYGVKAVTKDTDDMSSLSIKIDFFDLSGDPNYRDVRNEFYKDVDGLVLMYDVTEKTSFEALPSWLVEARKFGVWSSNTTLVVVGNKIDQYPRVITEQEGTAFAAENNAAYFETSAKSGASVDDVFDYMLRETCKNGYYK
ncbi:hypothetical protein HJC23_002146 [Cyclotella cryptica]|uniref:Uncharacterized protein n=1 Tax=Cyclotella cryptica TaxID=29204 RepID=A0ABD3Q691_9STRA|eukprot:CCRYP_008160-RA/>CCRYP_008160-RA protein AED:0.15 eAED:0.09 QI:0/0/0/1/1/1/3/0/211